MEIFNLKARLKDNGKIYPAKKEERGYYKLKFKGISILYHKEQLIFDVEN